jgi:hypothetical protein
MPTAIETARKADFRANPILSDYLATMLEDFQFSENDEACSEEREERDTGTIYTLNESEYIRHKRDCDKFYADNRADIDAALELVPGEEGLRYGRDYMTHERIGYYFYMVRAGHGVSFTDDGTPGEADCLSNLNKAARAFPSFDLYFGDDGEVYSA